MNTLIVYDSQYGNTEQIAQKLADTLGAIGETRLMQIASARPVDLQGLDLLIIGCPTQGWDTTPAMQSFLKGITSEHLDRLTVACFDTRFRMPHWMTGSAAEVLHKTLKAKGATLLVPPESFFVKGKQGPLHNRELNRAGAWARTLVQAVEVSQPVVR